MITFFNKQPPFNGNSTTSTMVTLAKSKEDTSRLHKAECTSTQGVRPFQVDVNKRIQRLQENYFLERRSFL